MDNSIANLIKKQSDKNPLANVVTKNVNSACKQIIPQNHDNPLPLSFAQQHLWFLAQLSPDSSAYNVANAMEIQGNLKVEFVQQAINAIVERHALLRSTIKQVDGQLVQIITSQQTVLRQIALSTDSIKAIYQRRNPTSF